MTIESSKFNESFINANYAAANLLSNPYYKFSDQLKRTCIFAILDSIGWIDDRRYNRKYISPTGGSIPASYILSKDKEFKERLLQFFSYSHKLSDAIKNAAIMFEELVTVEIDNEQA